MGANVNLYELTHEFWKESDYKPFSASAIALFFFLLDRANSRHWQMPLRCPTALICRSINSSKLTVLAARDALQQRGLIKFCKGSGKDNLPLYLIVTNPNDWTDHYTDDTTDMLTENLTDISTDRFTDDLTQYNIKDKIYFKNKEAKEENLSVEKLEELFLADEKWQVNVISLMSRYSPLSDAELKQQISSFFQDQKCKGVDRREERDCRTHFINWLKKQPQNSNQNNSSNGLQKSNVSNARRSAPVTAQSANDYAGKLSNRAPAGTTKTIPS